MYNGQWNGICTSYFKISVMLPGWLVVALRDRATIDDGHFLLEFQNKSDKRTANICESLEYPNEPLALLSSVCYTIYKRSLCWFTPP